MRSGKPERRHDAGNAFDLVTEEVFLDNESLASYTIYEERQFKESPVAFKFVLTPSNTCEALVR